VTEPLLPGRPSDGLIAPLNAPRGGQVSTGVQPGVSGNIVLAQYVVVFGESGGVFIYAGTPALGNPPLYWMGNVTQDPYGNPLDQGIWAGQPGSVQVGIQTSGAGPTGAARVFFIPVGSYAADAAVGIVQTSTQAILEVNGAQTTANPDPASDRVTLGLWDHGTSGLPGATAAFTAFYLDASGGGNPLLDGNCTGLNLYSVSTFAATEPGTGTSSTNPFVPETFHPITVDAGWTIVNQPAYRLLPGGNVQVVGLITHAATAAQTDINSANPVPVAYRPSVTRYYRTPQAADLAGAVEVQFGGVFTMRASGFNATQAILDGIYAL
jgi:hypothetical protein